MKALLNNLLLSLLICACSNFAINAQDSEALNILTCGHPHKFDFLRLGVEYCQIIPSAAVQENDKISSFSGQAIGLESEVFVKGKSLLISSGLKMQFHKMDESIDVASSLEGISALSLLQSANTIEHHFTSLQIPLQLKYRSPMIGKRSKVNLSGGIAQNLHLNSKSYLKDDASDGAKIILDEEFKNKQLSMLVGAAYEYNLGYRSMEFGLDYQQHMNSGKSAASDLQANQLSAHITFFF